MNNYGLFDILVFPPLDAFGFVVRLVYAFIGYTQAKDNNEKIGHGLILGFVGGLPGIAAWLAYLSMRKKSLAPLMGNMSLDDRVKRLVLGVFMIVAVGVVIIFMMPKKQSQREKLESQAHELCLILKCKD